MCEKQFYASIKHILLQFRICIASAPARNVLSPRGAPSVTGSCPTRSTSARMWTQMVDRKEQFSFHCCFPSIIARILTHVPGPWCGPFPMNAPPEYFSSSRVANGARWRRLCSPCFRHGPWRHLGASVKVPFGLKTISGNSRAEGRVQEDGLWSICIRIGVQ